MRGSRAPHALRTAVETLLTAAAFVVLERAGLLASTPVWLLLGLLFLAAATRVPADSRWGPDCSQAGLNARIALQTLGITAVIYATGWGPLLAVGYLFAAADNIARSGPRATRPLIGWSLTDLLVGQVAIGVGIAPTLVEQPMVHGLAGLVGLGVAFVIRILGSTAAEKEEAQRAVTASERRLRSLVANAIDPIILVDRDTTVTYASPAIESVIGYGAKALLGRQMRQLAHPDDLSRAVEGLAEAMQQSGRAARVDLRFRHQTEGWRWCQVGVTNLLADPGVQGIVVNVHDVTERREAEEALARAEARFRALVHTSADGIAVLDEVGRFTYVSPSYGRLTGHEAEELVGTEAGRLAYPDDIDALAAAWERLLRAPSEVVTVEARAAHRHGDWHWQEIAFTNLLDDPGVGGILLNVRDVTDRKRAEELLAGEAKALGTIARGAPLRETLEVLCRLVETNIPETYAALFVATGPDGLALSAAPSLPAAWVPVLERVPIGSGLVTHLTTGGRDEPAAQVLTGPVPAELRELAAAHGIRARWSAPFTRAGGADILGAFVIYSKTARPMKQQASLLSRLATLAAVAMEHARSKNELVHQATHDALTGLPNRAAFVDALRAALRRTGRSGSSVAVLFLDADSFKLVNDGFGHDTGDTLLAEIAERLDRTVRRTDAVARFGGDEFVALCEGLQSDDEALDAARRIHDAFAEPFKINGRAIYVSMSIGIATGGTNQSAEVLLRNADVAMYRAKERGPARTELFDASRAVAAGRLTLAAQLHEALGREELCLHYQPIIELSSGRAVGAEALLRWQHPRRGLLRAAEFIALAEETGLIVPIGRYVLDEAAHQLARWARVPGNDATWVNVNVSPQQLCEPEFAEHVEAALREVREIGVDPARLVLEITEGVLLEDTPEMVSVIRVLRELGVQVSIDDFGTGYSSLGYLRRLPLDMLKIDRSFVAELGRGAEHPVLLHSILEMAQRLGLTAVVEGVETAEQPAQLRALGCDYAQGYYLSPPKPPAELEDVFGSSADSLRALSASA